MGRKKKKPVKPWCWYCNREFDDDKILVQHQRAKHYKCPFCHKKLYSGPGLTVHCIQVHKETLDKIPEALPNRNSVDIDIYGMQGIPEDDVREHERLKRGEDAPSKPQESTSKTQQQPTQNQQKNIPPANLHHPAMSAMQAAMFQHALGMGAMPPGFPMPPPPTSIPQGPPPGFMQSTGFPPIPMLPGMSQAPMSFQPSMMPPSLTNHMGPPMGFPLPTHLGPMPSTSMLVPPPPPPMSGVGPLIGLMPPQYHPPPPMNNNPTKNRMHSLSSNNGNQETRSSEQRKADINVARSQTVTTSLSNNSDSTISQDDGSASSKSTSSSTISKPASTITSSANDESNFECDSFMDIPGTTSRIMHPNKDLSLEEIRLNLKKYRDMLKKSQGDVPRSMAMASST